MTFFADTEIFPGRAEARRETHLFASAVRGKHFSPLQFAFVVTRDSR